MLPCKKPFELPLCVTRSVINTCSLCTCPSQISGSASSLVNTQCLVAISMGKLVAHTHTKWCISCEIEELEKLNTEIQNPTKRCCPHCRLTVQSKNTSTDPRKMSKINPIRDSNVQSKPRSGQGTPHIHRCVPVWVSSSMASPSISFEVSPARIESILTRSRRRSTVAIINNEHETRGAHFGRFDKQVCDPPKNN